jgi:hypothetical protein
MVDAMGRADNGGSSSDDSRFVAARLLENYDECARALLPLTVWLPVRGPEHKYLVTERDNRKYVRVYTRLSALNAIASPDIHPELARPHRFFDLLKRWRSDDIGLVVNPGTDTEFRIPRELFDEVLGLREEPEFPMSPPQGPSGVPVDAPAEVGGFRFVAVVDQITDAGVPVVSETRGTVEDGAERERIRRYLDAGEVIQAVNGFAVDLFDQTKGEVVPMHTRTDGTWVWSDAVGYYLDTYGLALEPDFYRFVTEHDYTCPTPDRSQLTAAARALEERQFIAAELYERWKQDRR